jgi:hypothetical protein
MKAVMSPRTMKKTILIPRTRGIVTVITKIEAGFYRYCRAYTIIHLIAVLAVESLRRKNVARLVVPSKDSCLYHLHDRRRSPQVVITLASCSKGGGVEASG